MPPPQGALAGDDGFVVVGVDEYEVAVGGEDVGVGGGFLEGVAVEDDGGAPGSGAADLGRRGEFGHHDDAGDAEEAGVAGDGLGMVAGGHGDDAGLALGWG